jgi:hypothetical protein
MRHLTLAILESNEHLTAYELPSEQHMADMRVSQGLSIPKFAVGSAFLPSQRV